MQFNEMTTEALLSFVQSENWDELSFKDKLQLLFLLKEKRINNASARKLILHTVFTVDDLSEQVQNEKKQIKAVLVHAWGQRTASIVSSILHKNESERDNKEKNILGELLEKYISSQRQQKKLFETVRIILE